MSKPIRIEVNYPPPPKDGGLSIRNPGHSHAPLVDKLRERMHEAMKAHKPLTGVPVRLTMHYRRATSQADALNLINGVADIIQQRAAKGCEYPVWLIDDDKNVREFHYTEARADHDSYVLILETLE